MNIHDFNAIAREAHTTLESINIESGSDEAKTKATEEVIYLLDSLARFWKVTESNFSYDKFTEACGFHGGNTVDFISNPR